jgi:hypothetical protein
MTYAALATQFIAYADLYPVMRTSVIIEIGVFIEE